MIMKLELRVLRTILKAEVHRPGVLLDSSSSQSHVVLTVLLENTWNMFAEVHKLCNLLKVACFLH